MERFEMRIGHIRFVKVSAAYIDVFFGEHCSDCINIWDYQTGKCVVETREQFEAVCQAYVVDNAENLEGHWNAAFYATVTESYR